jgi:hypothetical protein
MRSASASSAFSFFSFFAMQITVLFDNSGIIAR